MRLAFVIHLIIILEQHLVIRRHVRAFGALHLLLKILSRNDLEFRLAITVLPWRLNRLGVLRPSWRQVILDLLDLRLSFVNICVDVDHFQGLRFVDANVSNILEV